MFQISAACELAFCHSVVSLAEPETVSKFIAAAFVVRLDVRSLHAETLLETVGIWTGRRTVERGETKQACAGDEAGCGRPDQGQGVLPEVD